MSRQVVTFTASSEQPCPPIIAARSLKEKLNYKKGAILKT
jgi:hypothetical protein